MMTKADDTLMDPKRAQVLESAMKVFLAYGFARTTMDDLARAAEMSRPALYLLFKNKTDVYRSTVALIFTRSVDQARIELDSGGVFTHRMERAIDAALISMMKPITHSPHGQEFLDLKSSLADLIGDWRAALFTHVSGAIVQEAQTNGANLAAKGLSAGQLTDMLLDGMDGLKMRTIDPDVQRQAAAAQIRVIHEILLA